MRSEFRSARGARAQSLGAKVLAALLFAFALFRPCDAEARTLTVTTTEDSGAGSLRETIALAAAGDTIEFLVSGTILLNTGPLVVTTDLAIEGPGVENLAVSGGFLSLVFDVRANSAVQISGLAITDGGDWDDSDPAAAIWNSGDLLLSAVSIVENGWVYGAPIVLNDGRLEIRSSDLSGNFGNPVAGILNLSTGDLRISDSRISENYSDPDDWGLALANLGAAVIENSDVTLNGRGIVNDGSLAMQDVSVLRNGTYGAPGCAGVHNTGFTLLSRVTVASNARYGGTGGVCNEGALTMLNSTVSGNYVGSDDGGGVRNEAGAVMRVFSSTVAHNRSWYGAQEISNLGLMLIKNSIVASESEDEDNWWACDNWGTILSLGGNLESDGTCGFNAAGDMIGDPLLVPLADNGGPTLTHALLHGSPAIDAVPVADCTDDLNDPLVTDQRGMTRPEGPACDVGAYEAAPEIGVMPLTLDFGDVVIGESASLIVTVSNLGPTDLVVDDLRLGEGSSDEFELSWVPVLPAVLPPANESPEEGTVDVEVSFAPSSDGLASAVLQIFSDDPDRSLVEVELSGSGTPAGLPPDEQIGLILDFYDAAVADGTLIGDGPGGSAGRRMTALRNMLEASGHLIRRGGSHLACVQLLGAARRADGAFPPPDFVSGEAAAELAGRIQDLRETLGCAVHQCGDADGDGDLDRDDASLTRRYLAGQEAGALFGERRCSAVSGDPMLCELRDLVMIRRHLAELPIGAGDLCEPLADGA